MIVYDESNNKIFKVLILLPNESIYNLTPDWRFMNVFALILFWNQFDSGPRKFA